MLNDDPVAGLDGFEAARRSIRPADLDIGRGCRPQPEVNAKVALRDVVAAAAYLVDLLPAVGGCLNACADRVTPLGGEGLHQ